MNQRDRSVATAATEAHQAGRHRDALDGYVRHLARHPDDAGIWSNLGALYRTLKSHELALKAQRRAHELRPEDPGIRNNLANILSDLGQYDESIELRRQALAQDPAALNQHAMIGRCMRGKGAYDEAIAYLEPLADKHPEEPEIELQLAFAQLGAGQYGAAFRSYDIRWHCEEMTPRNLSLPQWTEDMDLAGKKVLVLPEQGFGDAVLMARFLPALADKGAEVHFLAEKPMARLFEGLDGASWVGTTASADDGYDCWINLMDLPLLAYGPGEDHAPLPPARLNVPVDAVERAKAIIAPFQDRFRVGVVWSGSATYKGNAFRSFSHRDFLPLADIQGVQMFSLYKGPYLEQFNNDGAGAFIIDAASSDRDFADCAASMLEMDLIITSDTATAHIAGSLGVPVWTVLHWDPFWVFRHAGDATQWYPGMRLFRQTRPMRWQEPFDAVHAALLKAVKGKAK